MCFCIKKQRVSVAQKQKTEQQNELIYRRLQVGDSRHGGGTIRAVLRRRAEQNARPYVGRVASGNEDPPLLLRAATQALV